MRPVCKDGVNERVAVSREDIHLYEELSDGPGAGPITARFGDVAVVLVEQMVHQQSLEQPFRPPLVSLDHYSGRLDGIDESVSRPT